MRLDKFLSHMGYGSRKDVKALVRRGRVTVNGERPDGPECKIEPAADIVRLDGEIVEYTKYIYLMMNKPAGVLSASNDPSGEEETVSDLAFEAYGYPDLFPVGRLDKDATGLIILTNDGIFGHRATSPKKNLPKVYDVVVSGELTEKDIEAFRARVKLDDGYLCREAGLEILSSGPASSAMVTLTEGKFHQVKRMFQAVGKRVISLKRISFCGISLPGDLTEGECRPLTAVEMDIIAPLISQD